MKNVNCDSRRKVGTWERAWVTLLLALLALSSQSAIAITAEEILARPNRVEEERAAWNPQPIPMEAFLNPSLPLKENYPILEIAPRVGGMVFWMDNRYAMVWAGGHKDPETGIATPYLAILDTDTGEIYDYKAGRLMCYRANRLTYETGPNDEHQRRRWTGAPGQETEIPIFATEPNANGWRETYVVGEFDCENRLRDEYIRKAEALFGKFQPADSPREVYKRDIDPLLPEHGFLSTDMVRRLSTAIENRDRLVGLTWFKSNGDRQELDLAWATEVRAVEAKHWAPFLRRYVFQGGVLFNNLPKRDGVRMPSDLIYRLEDRRTSTATFSPDDGSIVKIRRPRYLLENVSTQAVYATRAGLLWVGSPVGPARGYYLSRGEEVKRIFNYTVHRENTWISPDGCKVMSYFDPSEVSGPSRMAGALGGILDFSSSSRGKKHMAIINLCKGD